MFKPAWVSGSKISEGGGQNKRKEGTARQIDKVNLTAFMKGLKGEIGKYPSTMKEAVSRDAFLEVELKLGGSNSQ